MRFTRNDLKKVLLRPLLLALAAASAQPILAQSFLQPKVIPTGNWPAAVYSADINGDGYPDLIYIDQGATPGQPSTTHVLLNDGHGNFTQSAVIATAGNSLAIADIFGQGKLDIAWLTLTGAPGNILISATFAPGNGDGTFQPSGTFGSVLDASPSVNVDYLHAGHIGRSTGILELAFENTATPTLYVMEIPPGLSSTAVTDARTLSAAGPMTLADLNADGLSDVVIQQGTSSAAVYLGYHYGYQFVASSPQIASGSTGIHSLLIQDVNNDGRPDLIAEGANGHIDVFAGNGDGTFQTTSSGGTGTLNGLTGNGGHLIATGDFNHDGLLDALTATPAGISVLAGQGTQYLGLSGIYNAGPGPSSGHSSYAVADFNNDGNPDLAVDSPEGIAILYGKSDGSFQTSQAFAAGQPAMSGALGAFTSSGHLDAVVSTGATQAQFLQGNGDGTFTYAGSPGAAMPTYPQPGPAGLWSTVLAGVEPNGTNNLSIILTADGPASQIPSGAGLSGTVVEYGGGDGTFSSLFPVNGYPVQCNGPIPSNYGTSVGTLWYGGKYVALVGRDVNGFEIMGPPGGLAYVGFQPTCGLHAHDLLASGDLNNDGFPDLVTQTDGHLQVYLNGTNHTPVLQGDLAVDGSLTTAGQLVAPDISATFPGQSAALGFRAFPGSMAIVDLDRDGNGDFLVAYDNMDADHTAPTAVHPNGIYIWYGSGNGKFLTSSAHPVNPVVLTPTRNFYQVAVADMNGDGIPDLILSDGYILSIQLGKGDGTFGAEAHYLAGQGINTISVGDLSGTGHNDLVLANGGTVLTNPVANKEVLATNPDVNTGGVTVLRNNILPLPTATVAANPEPSTYGSAFTLVLTFTTTGSVPTGTVTFSVDGVVVGTTTILGINSPGVIYPAANTLAVGSHVLTAAYSGDSNYQATTFTGSHAVVAGYSVTASPEPSTYGSSFTVTGVAPGPGTFQFSVDGTPIGTVISTTNTASAVAPGTYAVGSHTLTLAWTAQFSALAVIFTGSHQVVINPTTLSLLLCVDNPGSLFPCGNPIATTPLLSPITFFYGQTLDGVATESASNLTGSIIFYDGTRIFCTLTANLGGGTNTCPPDSGDFHAGNRTVYATYTGDPNNAASTSNSIAVYVFPGLTTAKLTTSLTPAVVGTTLTFTAVLASAYATPTGAVNFFDGTTLLGGGSLDPSGTAAFTTATLAVGTHQISVVYAGTSDFTPLTSLPLTQVITTVIIPPPPGTGFTLGVTPDPVSIGAGATGALLVRVSPQTSSYPPAVTLTCSGLPDESTCNFVTPTIPAGGGSTTLQLHVSAPHDCGTTTPYFIGSTDGPASPIPYSFAAVFFGAFAIYKRRRKLKGSVILSGAKDPRISSLLLLLALSLASLASLSGCGHCTDLGTRPGNYTFTVTATAQGTSTTPTQSVTIPLTVTIP